MEKVEALKIRLKICNYYSGDVSYVARVNRILWESRRKRKFYFIYIFLFSFRSNYE